MKKQIPNKYGVGTEYDYKKFVVYFTLDRKRKQVNLLKNV